MREGGFCLGAKPAAPQKGTGEREGPHRVPQVMANELLENRREGGIAAAGKERDKIPNKTQCEHAPFAGIEESLTLNAQLLFSESYPHLSSTT